MDKDDKGKDKGQREERKEKDLGSLCQTGLGGGISLRGMWEVETVDGKFQRSEGGRRKPPTRDDQQREASICIGRIRTLA